MASSSADLTSLPKPTLFDKELGVSSILPFSTSFTAGATRGLVVPVPDVTVEQLVEMRRKDGQARALYRVLTLPIRSALRTAKFVPGDGDKGEAEFIEQMLTLPPSAGGMTIHLHRVMAQLLMAVFDGYSAFEQVYWVPTKGPLQGKIALKKLAYRPSTTVRFLADDNGDFNGIRQLCTFNGKTIDVVIAPEDTIYYAANEEENPFYGVSYFNSAFYHYDKKVKLYYLAHLGAQSRAVTGRVGKLPQSTNVKDKAAFVQAVQDFGLAQAMVLPFGYEVTPLPTSGVFDAVPLIEHHNTQMSKSVLAMFLDSQQRQTLVDFSTDKDEMFLLGLRTVMDEVAAIINHKLIPKFIDWNFPKSESYPEFQWGVFSDEQQRTITDTFGKLAAAASMNVSRDFMYELEKHMSQEMGLEIDYTVLDKEFEASKAEAQKQGIIMPSFEKPGNPPAPGQPGGAGGAPIPGAVPGKVAPPVPHQPPKPGGPPGKKMALTADGTVDTPEDILARALAASMLRSGEVADALAE